MVILMNTEKGFNKIHPFLLKTSESIGINGVFLKMVSCITLKPRAYICYGHKLEGFPRRSSVKQRCPLSPPLFIITLEIVAIIIKEKEIAGIKLGSGETKLAFFVDNEELDNQLKN